MRALLLLTLLGACAPAFTLPLPERFVALEDQEENQPAYRLRATTPDGVVLAARTLDNDVEGSAAFWTEAVTRRVRDQLGYVLLAEEALTAASGQPGTLLRFGRDLEGHGYRYLLALFVTEDTLYLVEAGGRDEAYAAQQEALEDAIRSFRL